MIQRAFAILFIVVIGIGLIGAALDKKEGGSAENSVENSQKSSSSVDAVSTEKPPTATPDPKAISRSQRDAACDVAKQFVKARLKAPSTAKFPGCGDMGYERDGDAWKVSGYVDSENSFSAMLRSQFYIEMTATGADSFVLTTIKIQ